MVLVVDDDSATREALEELIDDEGYGVATAATAEEALGRLQCGLRPVVVVADHGLARMTGSELLRACRRDPSLRRIGRILTSAFSPDLVDQTDLAGIVFIPKPFSIDVLLLAIARMLPDARAYG